MFAPSVLGNLWTWSLKCTSHFLLLESSDKLIYKQFAQLSLQWANRAYVLYVMFVGCYAESDLY
jgi:hypothetical protein